MTLSDERRAEVDGVLAAVRAWAVATGHVRAVALVGSQARGDARMDSDVDLVILTAEPATLAGEEGWWSFLGPSELVRRKQWGALAERRVRLATGLEVELGVVGAQWARVPLDEGTRRVLLDGACVLYDPQGLLRAAIAAARDAS